jgi:alkylation response protein AidB-like acyl-CoA dehydrogenase
MSEHLDAFRQTAALFAKKEIEPLLGREGRDGDLSLLPGILQKARETGLTATADPAGAGWEYGVWGRACRADGPAASLAVLQEIARTCAGAAACIHLAGLAAFFSDDGAPPAAVAFFEPAWIVDWPSLRRPPADACRLTPAADGAFRIAGVKHFVHAAPEFAGLLIFAAASDGWRLAFAPKTAAGVELADPGPRLGLAAIEMAHVTLRDCRIEASAVRAGEPAAFLRRHLLGLSAIAVGNAAGALRAALAYAAERYQGGEQLDALPAVRRLLGDSGSRVAAAAGFLDSVAQNDRDDPPSLARACAAKLRITTDCAQAVTDCLQVLGGYGYMEDYRLEKRLRDAIMLKLMAVKPDALRELCAAAETEGAR